MTTPFLKTSGSNITVLYKHLCDQPVGEFMRSSLYCPVQSIILNDGSQSVRTDPVNLRQTRDLPVASVLVVSTKQDVTVSAIKAMGRNLWVENHVENWSVTESFCSRMLRGNVHFPRFWTREHVKGRWKQNVPGEKYGVVEIRESVVDLVVVKPALELTKSTVSVRVYQCVVADFREVFRPCWIPGSLNSEKIILVLPHHNYR